MGQIRKDMPETFIFDQHKEFEYIPAHAAPETAEVLSLGIDRKARICVLMEGAKRLMVPVEGQVLSDDLDDISPFPDSFNNLPIRSFVQDSNTPISDCG